MEAVPLRLDGPTKRGLVVVEEDERALPLLGAEHLSPW